MPSYLERLERLSVDLGREANDEHEAFIKLLKRIISVVREADNVHAPDLPEVVEKAAEMFEEAVYWAYSLEGGFDYLPSFADSSESPLLKDSHAITLPGVGEIPTEILPVLETMTGLLSSMLGGFNPLPGLINSQRPKAWPDTPHPHPKTSRLSRFREGITTSVTDASPLARTIYQARCEVSAENISCPVSAAIAADSSALALIGAGGYKDRDPMLTIFLLDEQTPTSTQHDREDDAEDDEPEGDDDEDNDEEDDDDYEDDDDDDDDGGARICSSETGFRYMALEPGLSEVAYQVAVDTPNRLALIADPHRIKTFSWGGDVAFSGWIPARGDNVHTMNSKKYEGPIAVLPGGRIVRAGKGGAALWNLSTLETHRGGRRVGRGKFKVEDSWRDDGGEIERSTGSAPSTTVKFAQKGLTPAGWHLHAPSGHLLSAENSHRSEKYGCYALDLEAGGKIASRFLGHGGNVNDFSTSAGDANAFLTACADGYARLYDVRHPLPVMTIDSGKSSEFCEAAALVHPDGIPTVFTGGYRSQSIKTWDIRARALVYELSTGNTAVHTLAWDDRRATLYAGTECDYRDRLGGTYDYRGAHIPRWAERQPGERSETDADADGYNSAEDSDGEHCWPKRAPHDEKAFGYAYDAGDHVFLRYRFKEDADRTVLPEYGQAREEYGYGGW
ncbi:hypothetical protein VTO73DRAFT_9180 [Trametes versicolor]